MYQFYNANPIASRVGDCTIRAISKVLGQSWIKTYIEICLEGLVMYDMPSANQVWGKYLKDNNYTRHLIPNTNPDRYTVRQFAEDHKTGRYILALQGHVVACIDGTYYDTWDSGDEVPIYYWKEN